MIPWRFVESLSFFVVSLCPRRSHRARRRRVRTEDGTPPPRIGGDAAERMNDAHASGEGRRAGRRVDR